jgi:hypothetical protein
MCVIRLKGKDIDALENTYKSFDMLKPFPKQSSKFTKLYDKTWTLAPNKTTQLEMTLQIDSWLGRRPGTNTHLDDPDRNGSAGGFTSSA